MQVHFAWAGFACIEWVFLVTCPHISNFCSHVFFCKTWKLITECHAWNAVADHVICHRMIIFICIKATEIAGPLICRSDSSVAIDKTAFLMLIVTPLICGACATLSNFTRNTLARTSIGTNTLFYLKMRIKHFNIASTYSVKALILRICLNENRVSCHQLLVCPLNGRRL